ncbi:MAG TPA: response regulator transcription factor [Candidatus Dormibacteraeota bacterium]|nr:response regulator transcription factor [Candidatus Dormibacteraeota bacterium]
MPQEVRDRRPGPARVLVVDDEPAITEFIKIGLSREGFEVETAPDGRAALAAVDRFAPDVVVLDVMMPRMDGIALTKALAGDPRRGLVILSARDDTHDRIVGLDLGADDYLGKPFEFGELLARVRSLLRRRQPDLAAVLRVGSLQLDRSTRKVSRDSQEVELSAREFDLLAYFMEHRGEALTRDRLLNAVWGVSFFGDENNLEVYVSYLRLKLSDTDRQLIQTVRGVGYRLAAD